jgi:hypothetical protein
VEEAMVKHIQTFKNLKLQNKGGENKWRVSM